MSAVPIPVEITCPQWCTVTTDAHRAELINWDGRVIHHSSESAMGGRSHPLCDDQQHRGAR